MANVVEVRGGGDFDGAVLENAATEATLQRLVSVLEKQSPGAGASVQQMQQNMAKNLKQTNANLEETNKGLSGFSKALNTASGVLDGAFSSALDGIIGFLSTGLDAFRNLSSVGASFNNSIFEIAKTAAEANLSIGQFADLVSKNSSMLAGFGGTVTGGAERFAKLLDSDKFRDPFLEMGLTVSDINDFLSANLELEVRRGRARNMSDKQLQESTRAYITELDNLSKLTGISRKDQEAAMRQVALDPILRAISVGPEATANVALLNQVPDLLDSIKEIAAGVPTSPGAVGLQSMLGLSQNQAMDLLSGRISGENSIKMMRDMYRQIESQFSGMGPAQRAALIQLNPYYKALATYEGYLSQYANMTDADIKAAALQQQNIDLITSSLAKASNSIERIKNNFLAMFFNSEQFKGFLTGIEDIATWFESSEGQTLIKGFVDGISNFFKSITDGLQSWLKGQDAKTFFDGIGKWFETLSTNFNDTLKKTNDPFKAIGQLLSDIFSPIFSAIGKMLTDFFTGLFSPTANNNAYPSRIPGGTNDKSPLDSIFGWFKNLFDNLGVTGFFKNIGEGFSKATSFISSISMLDPLKFDQIMKSLEPVISLFKAGNNNTSFNNTLEKLNALSITLTSDNLVKTTDNLKEILKIVQDLSTKLAIGAGIGNLFGGKNKTGDDPLSSISKIITDLSSDQFKLSTDNLLSISNNVKEFFTIDPNNGGKAPIAVGMDQFKTSLDSVLSTEDSFKEYGNTIIGVIENIKTEIKPLTDALSGIQAGLNNIQGLGSFVGGGFEGLKSMIGMGGPAQNTNPPQSVDVLNRIHDKLDDKLTKQNDLLSGVLHLLKLQ